jgi:L-rhamnose mutarotase
MAAAEAVYGTTNPTPEQFAAMPAKRYGSVFELNPEFEQLYRDLHANARPAIIDRLHKSNITNFAIFIVQLAGRKYVVSCYDYGGTDHDADQQAITDDPETQRWWKELAPCEMVRSGELKPDAKNMELVFFMA